MGQPEDRNPGTTGAEQPAALQPPGPQPVTIEGSDEAPTFYEAVGGRDTFEALVSGFYARVANDPVLVAIYPDDEWAAAANRLLMFLEQYWGGPHTYSEQRGHPRLRARHAVFVIDQTAHDHWLTHMRSALDDVELAPEADQILWSYLQNAAAMLVNTPAG